MEPGFRFVVLLSEIFFRFFGLFWEFVGDYR